MQREAHTSVHTLIDIYPSKCSHHCLHSDPHVHTSESQVQTSEGARAIACPPVCVCIMPLRVSQALGKAAGCIRCRHWKEQESQRAARCVIYICLCM